eukprot:scaffold29558_cov146-Isochrysis_galbana.AAC.2
MTPGGSRCYFRASAGLNRAFPLPALCGGISHSSLHVPLPVPVLATRDRARGEARGEGCALKIALNRLHTAAWWPACSAHGCAPRRGREAGRPSHRVASARAPCPACLRRGRSTRLGVVANRPPRGPSDASVCARRACQRSSPAGCGSH